MIEVAYVGTSGRPAADGVQHQRGAARRDRSRLPGSRSGRRSARSASSPTAPIPPITACNRKSKSGFRAGCTSWVPTLGRSRSTTRATARTIRRASGQYPQDPLNPGLDRGLSSFDRTHGLWQARYGKSRSGATARGSTLRRALTGALRRMAVERDFRGANRNAVQRADALRGRSMRKATTAGPIASRAASCHRPSDRSRMVRYGRVRDSVPAGVRQRRTQYPARTGQRQYRPGAVQIVSLGTSGNAPLADSLGVLQRLNHTNLGLPVNSIDSPAFGTITSASPARVIQLGARLEF